MPNKTVALTICAICFGAALHGASADPASQNFGMVTRGTRIFYETKKQGEAPDLMVRDGTNARKIVDGTQGAVTAFQASPDGSKLAVVLGHDAASLSVYDAATATRIAGPIAIEGSIAGWSEDARTLYFTSRQAGTLRLMAWPLRSKPEPIQTFEADTVSLAMRNGEVILLSGNAAARKLTIRAGQTASAAAPLMESRHGLTLDSVYPASDGIYVLAHDGSQTRLLRIASKADGRMHPVMPQHALDGCRNCRSLPAMRLHRVSEIDMPADTATTVLSDPQTPGLTIVIDRHGAEFEVLHYDPSAGRFISERMKPLM